MWHKLKERIGRPVVEPATPEPDLAAHPGMAALLDAGDVRAAMDLFISANPAASATDRARVELQMRHEAFVRAAQRGEQGDWPPVTSKVLAGTGLPEITAAELDRDVLVAGVRQRGALLVRGLFAEQACADLRQMIDAAMAAFDRDPHAVDPQWNQPLSNVRGEPLSHKFRTVNFDPSGRPVADVPVAAQRVMAEFDRVGLTGLVQQYLGERPAVSLEKWTLRRVPPDTNSSWHQDGAFLGTDKHTLNLWVALSDCGQTASGLDVVARRFDHIVPTGTEGAFFDWDVSPQVVDEQRGEDPIVSPVFQPGDAVFFDQFLLHRTGVKPGLVDDRYALESWFFTPTSFPGHYEGLLL